MWRFFFVSNDYYLFYFYNFIKDIFRNLMETQVSWNGIRLLSTFFLYAVVPTFKLSRFVPVCQVHFPQYIDSMLFFSGKSDFIEEKKWGTRIFPKISFIHNLLEPEWFSLGKVPSHWTIGINYVKYEHYSFSLLTESCGFKVKANQLERGTISYDAVALLSQFEVHLHRASQK